MNSITCPVCGKTSYHPTDINEGYCGNCHDYTSRSTAVHVFEMGLAERALDKWIQQEVEAKNLTVLLQGDSVNMTTTLKEMQRGFETVGKSYTKAMQDVAKAFNNMGKSMKVTPRA